VLDERIRARMPAVELTDILVEVDGWTGFSELLREASAGGQEGPEPVAALLAAACNIPCLIWPAARALNTKCELYL
jgi:hypothetical protein